jgi:RNA polymerase sigma-70 factor (ECF subfamily)
MVSASLPGGRVSNSRVMSLTASFADQTDSDLLRQAALGEEPALGALYDRYASALYGVALRIAGERADAEEIVIDAFAQAWREAGRFQSGRGSVIAWLTVICRSRALDLVRARGRRGKLIASAHAEEPERSPAMGAGIDTTTGDPERAERSTLVRRALVELSDPQRHAVELAFYEGLSHSEIAERLGEPLGTIKTRLRLGMQKLRDTLRPYYTGPGQ